MRFNSAFKGLNMRAWYRYIWGSQGGVVDIVIGVWDGQLSPGMRKRVFFSSKTPRPVSYLLEIFLRGK